MAYIRTELVTALERGMVVLQSFSQQSLRMTLSEVARANGLTVATARRAVLTLEQLGCLGRNERRFVLRPRVLSLSAGYLTAIRRPFQPFVEGIVRELHGSASVAVLDSGYVICVAYASTNPPGDVRRRCPLAGACDCGGPSASLVAGDADRSRVSVARCCAALDSSC